MRHTPLLRRSLVALAVAAVTGLGTTTAVADPGIPNVGYGYPNPSQSVRCVQFFVNAYTNLHLLEDGKFGPQTELGVRRLQELSNFTWATRELRIDGVFGQDTGQAVLEHVKRNPWTTGDFTKATRCGHYVPSHTVVLN